MVASCSAEKKLVRSAELSKKLSKDEYKTEYGVYVSQLRIECGHFLEWNGFTQGQQESDYE